MLNIADLAEMTRMPTSAGQFLGGREIRIRTECSFLSPAQVRRVEVRYKAKYVFESQLKLRSDKWSDFPAAVFYSEEPHPKGSNWLWPVGQSRAFHDLQCCLRRG
jgi:hypothetical protein